MLTSSLGASSKGPSSFQMCVRRGEHTLVQESHQDVGLLEAPVLVYGSHDELRQGPMTSRKLEGAPSSLDPPRSSCGADPHELCGTLDRVDMSRSGAQSSTGMVS